MLDTHTQHRKLAGLAYLLDQMNPDLFWFDHWVEGYDPDTRCGTSACVAGWAATYFYDEGLRFNRSQEVVYDDLFGARAFAKFFCIDQVDADRITMDAFEPYYRAEYGDPDGDPDDYVVLPGHAADRIRTLLAKYAFGPQALANPIFVEEAAAYLPRA